MVSFWRKTTLIPGNFRAAANQPTDLKVLQLEAREPLSQVNKPHRDKEAHNEADGEHSEHDLSPASVNGVAGHDG